ncbi:MAG: hypothetical protein ACJ79S_05885 [Gemmatimonadaceae bacterium]
MSSAWRRTVGIALVALAAVGGPVACVRRGASAGEGPSPSKGAATVLVQNRNSSDVDVYVVQAGGVPFRLGAVTVAGTATFTVDPSYFPSGQIGLLARPRTGPGVARTAPISIFGARVIVFSIEPEISASYATVR